MQKQKNQHRFQLKILPEKLLPKKLKLAWMQFPIGCVPLFPRPWRVNTSREMSYFSIILEAACQRNSQINNKYPRRFSR